MYDNTQIVSFLQANKILALKLDHAVAGVKQLVFEQIDTIGDGLQRLTYYSSYFTDEYMDVCRQQRHEDARFVLGIIKVLHERNVIYEMLRIYFEEVLKYKTSQQLEHIKKMLMNVNVHIAASPLTSAGFALGTASAVTTGMKINLETSAALGRYAGTAVGVAGFYGIVQKAADCANRLRYTYPAYYSALYAHSLEMMFFVIAPTFEQAEAYKVQSASDEGITNIISRMIG